MTEDLKPTRAEEQQWCRCGINDQCQWPLQPGFACKIACAPHLRKQRDSLVGDIKRRDEEIAELTKGRDTAKSNALAINGFWKASIENESRLEAELARAREDTRRYLVESSACLNAAIRIVRNLDEEGNLELLVLWSEVTKRNMAFTSSAPDPTEAAMREGEPKP